MNLKLQHSIIFCLVLLSFSYSFAQESGNIQGVVKDSTTGEVLYGANVWLEGQSLGAATDMDGKYRIVNIPAGSYSLIVRYIGYRQKVVQVNVVGGRTLELNVTLPSEVIEGKPVVVTAQAVGQRAAINQQLTSNTIINVVSAEKIHQLPDDNAATALSRLPGVSLMNGDQIVIRGVQAKLNQVLINGIQLPSTDMNNRSTNLGFISSNLLSGIEVIKALTPDMDANTIGGVVNLRLREAPTGLHFDALVQGNYNSQDHVADNYKFWASVSNRFFDDKLGVFLQGNADRTDGGNQRAAITPTFLGTTPAGNAYGQATYITSGANFEYDVNLSKTSGGSLILDYRLPNGKIVFQNTYAGNLTDQANNQIQLSFDNTSASYTEDRELYGKDLWINALQAENTFGIVKVEASLSHSSSQQYTRYGHQLNPWTLFSNASHLIAPFGVAGYDAQGKAIPVTYNGAAEQGLSIMDALKILDNLNPADADSAILSGWVSEHYNQFTQHLYNTSLDVSVPVTFSTDINAQFKTGGKYVRTTRVNNVDEYFAHSDGDLYANPISNNYFVNLTGQGQPLSALNKLKFTQVMDTDFKRGKYYMSDLYDFNHGAFPYVIDNSKYDAWLKLSKQGWAVPLMKSDSYKDDWNGAEQFSAGYAMGTFNIGPKLTLLGGVRYESYRMAYHAQFTYVTHTVYGDCVSTEIGTIGINDSTNVYYTQIYHPRTVPYSAFNVDRTDNNLFPDVQLQYKAFDWADFRLAYTTGIARPDYISIIPKVAFYAGNFELGNPLLKPSTVQNFDIVASFHNNDIGLFTIDAFYKVIKNQMYGTSIYYSQLSRYAENVYIPDSAFLYQRFGFTVPGSQTVGISLNNPNNGFIRGIELDWQTNFWYLPGLLSSLVLDVNYTKSGSNTAYTTLINEVGSVIVNGRPHPTYSTVDSTYDGRLIQQANDVVNVALGVDYKGFSGRISFSMTGNVVNGIGNRPETNSYTGNIYRWDFTVKQELPIDGLSLSLNGVNIFHNGIKTYRNYRLKPDAPITQNLISVLYYPSVFQMNLRYSF